VRWSDAGGKEEGGKMNLVIDMIEWLHALPGDFLFLLGLPFLVAVAGLLGEWRRERRETQDRLGSAPGSHF
jgi:hypothetical protein